MKSMDQKEMINGRLMDWVLNTVPLGGFLACAWSLAVALFFNCSTYTILFLALLALTGFYFRENFQTLSGPGGRLFNYLKTKYEILTGSVPTVMKTASEIRQEQLDFATDDFYLDDKGIIDLGPEVGGRDPTNFNYKVKIKVENDSFVIAELDSDSHISLISESYFNRLSELTEIKYLPEAPVTFNGMGSTVTSPYSPIELQIQLGRVRMTGRFIVTNLLTSSPILLGTDFTVKFKISIAPHTKDQ
jgi:hypothetical protein